MDFKKYILYWWLGAWANEKNIYEFGFHSSPLCSLGADVPGCSLGKPGTWLGSENMETWRIIQLTPHCHQGPAPSQKVIKACWVVSPTALLLILEMFPVSVFQPGDLLLASQNTKSSFWPVPSPK